MDQRQLCALSIYFAPIRSPYLMFWVSQKKPFKGSLDKVGLAMIQLKKLGICTHNPKFEINLKQRLKKAKILKANYLDIDHKLKDYKGQ